MTWELYGVRPDVSVINAAGLRRTNQYLVRVLDGGETLARQTGLLDARRRPVRGLPNKLTTGSRDDVAAVWRGAFLARGSLTDPGRSAALEVTCPGSETAMALVGAAGRLGISAKAREVRGVHRVVIRDGEAISSMLALMGATETVRNWEELRQRREVRATANRLVNFDDANLRRSAQPPWPRAPGSNARWRSSATRSPSTCATRASCGWHIATRAWTSSATTPTRR